MAGKIILFVSILRSGNREKLYMSPNGKQYMGLQTNEAPVQYLLENHPDISKIICVVTEEAQSETYNEGKLIQENAWEQFQKTVNTFYHKELEKIDWNSGQTFEMDILPEILGKIESDDTIYLETSGGKRDNVMYLTLLSRALTYLGVTIGQAVYSDFQKEEIKDITSQYRLFDLIGGMQDMASFGNVGKLREYFGNPASDSLIEDLLSTMEQLFENITLCRTRKIDDSMKAFNKALKQAEGCEDPLMRQLLPAFRKKFGKDKKLTIPRLILWCVDSDMVQQALTVYTERVPSYIIDIQKLLIVSDPERKLQTASDKKGTEYHDPCEMIFRDGFLQLAHRKNITPKEGEDNYITTLRNLSTCMEGTTLYALNCSCSHMHQIALDYLFLKDVRNMTNHAHSEATADNCHLDYYKEQNYPNIDKMTMIELKQFIRKAIRHLQNR